MKDLRISSLQRYAGLNILVCILFCTLNSCLSPNEDNPGEGGYLFAHMLKSDYGRLYYSISRDGQNWELLKDSIRIDSIYRGHPDICKGANGCYYMIGAEEFPARPVLWKSKDLLSWSIDKQLPDSLFIKNGTGHSANPAWFGAPKMYFDKASGKYLITWHAPKEGIPNGKEWWKSMRTFYTLSADFESFTTPKRLFDFDGDDAHMATIDVIIRKTGSRYYAIIKDERWPEDSPNGKTIRISTSNNLTGPYSNPGTPITPAWFEAPSLVPTLDNSGWYIYAENYPYRYIRFHSDSLSGSWTSTDIKLEGVRHGCVIRINEDQYVAMEAKLLPDSFRP